MSEVNEFWHLIDGEYVQLVQITNGKERTYYVNCKQQGLPVDITGPMYAKREYATEMVKYKSSEGEHERERAIR